MTLSLAAYCPPQYCVDMEDEKLHEPGQTGVLDGEKVWKKGQNTDYRMVLDQEDSPVL